MLLQTSLFLSLILAAIVLIVATLLRDGEGARAGAVRAALERWRVGSGAVFLASAAALLAATGERTGSLLAGHRSAVIEVVRAEDRAPEAAGPVNGGLKSGVREAGVVGIGALGAAVAGEGLVLPVPRPR